MKLLPKTALTVIKKIGELSVVDSSVGRALSFSHEGLWLKSRNRHLFILLFMGSN
jgi:hypothetical protein